MRFRILNEKNKEQKGSKSNQKDLQTRQSSANKYSRQNSFLKMVKNSYDFYMTMGKDSIRDQQEKVAIEKEQKLKKIKKKEAVQKKRERVRLRVQRRKAQKNDSEQGPKSKKQLILEPSRRSQRHKTLFPSSCNNFAVDDKEIFDVLNIDEESSRVVELEKEPSTNTRSFDKAQQKKQQIIEKISKLKQELIFEAEGTYEIGVAHEALLRTQKFIDQHLNFRHEIRQSQFIEFEALMKYVKSHGFVTFDEAKFKLLTKINPQLYSFSCNDKNYIATLKLSGLQIQNRVEATRRRMTQASTPELYT